MNPGDMFEKQIGNCPHLILLLSSDREPGIEYMQDKVYRCVQFQIGSHKELFGAQLVLYTIPELEGMRLRGNLLEVLCEKKS